MKVSCEQQYQEYVYEHILAKICYFDDCVRRRRSLIVYLKGGVNLYGGRETLVSCSVKVVRESEVSNFGVLTVNLHLWENGQRKTTVAAKIDADSKYKRRV